MRRILVRIVGLYVLTTVVARAMEATGVGPSRFSCDCEDVCWCKQPGWTLFRWVTPRRWHGLIKSQEPSGE